MWLINTDTFKLEYVMNHVKGSYAILSHTWEEDEISFQDFQDLRIAKEKAGFAKTQQTVWKAGCMNLKYVWVDTCCIDKSSSAELSEAINSMFRWYTDAAVCYAYLSDFPDRERIAKLHPEADGPHIKRLQSTSFARCRWFERGWTLQELLAPDTVKCYDSDWNLYGTKTTLEEKISRVTRIPVGVLRKSTPLHQVMIARKMSWTANRKTTRLEDTAYCLMGIFDINMALLYGEGVKAFIRLQEEICKQSSDLSLFAWTAPFDDIDPLAPSQAYRGILSASPAEFKSCHTILPYQGRSYQGEFRMPNRGLCLEQLTLRAYHGSISLGLDWYDESTGSAQLAIDL
ncbi:Uu.00g052710.m01.CDS01 [Anthostomella pinea]|uniref:Uu.00g052710.m01.CDS01 n=1 Tax=Anthostomella pinea TaxID=933095 RepID=A0AAI8VWB8_9PEZI|nr:Uu.00g052710.m01.CDS01 [Anthostomella pinea]